MKCENCHISLPSAITLVVVGMTACETKSATPASAGVEATSDGSDAVDGADGSAEWAFVPAALPVQAVDPSCDPGGSPQTLALCDWAGRSSAVIVGEVLAVEALDVPWFRDGAVETEEDCDSTVEAALRLTIAPLETLYGPPPTGPVSVYIGAQQNQRGYPYATVSANPPGTIEWKETPEGGAPPYAEGSTLLLALQEADGGRWSVMGEKVRTFTVGGAIVESDEKECGVYLAPALADVVYEDLVADLAQCDAENISTTASDAAAEKATSWAQADRSYAALCHAVVVEDPEGYCEFQSMCDSGFVCQDKKCVQADSN